MKSENERKFRNYARYYEAVHGEAVWIDKVHKAPAWCGDRRRNAYTVYFRSARLAPGEALLTGHGPSYDAAFGMLFEYYMRREGAASEAEMEIKYAAAGV